MGSIASAAMNKVASAAGAKIGDGLVALATGQMPGGALSRAAHGAPTGALGLAGLEAAKAEGVAMTSTPPVQTATTRQLDPWGLLRAWGPPLLIVGLGAALVRLVWVYAGTGGRSCKVS